MASPKAIASASSSPVAAGAFTDAMNAVVANGYLMLTPTFKSAELTGGGIVSGSSIKVSLDANGVPAAGQSAFFSDQFASPVNPAFSVLLFNSKDSQVSDLGLCVISGAAPVDLTTITPTSAGVSYATTVLTNPAAQQNINGQTLNMEGASLSFSAASSTTADSFFSRLAAGVIGVGTAIGNALGTLRAKIFQIGSASTGLSEDSAGVIDVGNGTQGDKSGTVNAATLAATSTVNTPQVQNTAAAALTLQNANGVWRINGANATFANVTDTIGISLGLHSVYKFSNNASGDGGAVDTGISRTAAGKVAIGNGTQGDASGTLNVAKLNNGADLALPTTAGTVALVPTIALKKGTGAGNYSSSSTTYVQVDGTNLTNTVTIPTGWKLIITAEFRMGTNTAAVFCTAALADGGTVVVETGQQTPAAGTLISSSLQWVINGDGASHTVDLRFKTSNGADAVAIGNTNSTDIPVMVFTLLPTN